MKIFILASTISISPQLAVTCASRFQTVARSQDRPAHAETYTRNAQELEQKAFCGAQLFLWTLQHDDDAVQMMFAVLRYDDGEARTRIEESVRDLVHNAAAAMRRCARKVAVSEVGRETVYD